MWGVCGISLYAYLYKGVPFYDALSVLTGICMEVFVYVSEQPPSSWMLIVSFVQPCFSAGPRQKSIWDRALSRKAPLQNNLNGLVSKFAPI